MQHSWLLIIQCQKYSPDEDQTKIVIHTHVYNYQLSILIVSALSAPQTFQIHSVSTAQ